MKYFIWDRGGSHFSSKRTAEEIGFHLKLDVAYERKILHRLVVIFMISVNKNVANLTSLTSLEMNKTFSRPKLITIRIIE